MWSVAAALAPVLMWWVMVADHAGFNATGALGRAWVETPRPSAPWVLRATGDWTAEGAHRGLLLFLLLMLALLVDARRLRRADNTVLPSVPVPDSWSALLWAPGPLADRWCRALTRWTALVDAQAPRAVLATVRVAGSVLWAACALAAYCGRDLAVMVVSRSREPGENATPAVLRAVAASAMLRTLRLDAMSRAAPVETRRSRWVARILAVVAAVLLVAAATWLATRLASQIGLSVIETPGPGWLAGLLNQLADWWNSLGPIQQILIIAGIAALIVLSGGSFGLALALAGGAGFLATHGHGAADFVRDPRRATTDFVTNLTPQQLAGYALETALARVLPAGVGGVAGRGTRRVIDDYRRDPAAFRADVRNRPLDDRGSYQIGRGRQIISGEIARFDSAGVKYTGHFANRLNKRGFRGVTGETALRAYNQGSLFYDPKRRSFVRFDRQTGVAVVLRGGKDGAAHTAFVQSGPSSRWHHVPFRRGG